MSRQNRNVINMKRDIKINIATCTIVAVLIYVLISIFIASSKEPITTYKVNKTSVSNNITLDGLVIREEKILKSNKAGYICYYIRDGEKIKKNSTVCTVDETGQVYNLVNDSGIYDGLLTEKDYNDIRSMISLYKVGYNDDRFFTAYGFYNNANNKVLELTNEILMQQSTGGNAINGLSAISSPDSGIITYYTDGFEDFKISDITKDAFDKSSYKKQTLKSGDVVSANSPIVKIIPSEKWNIVAPISSEEISVISNSEKVVIRINNSDKEIRMPYEIINSSDGSYINIMLDKYMTKYLAERYVNVEIVKDEDIGLKVPMSAVVDKEVYKVSLEYLSGGGNQNFSEKINLKSVDENGELTVNQITPNILKKDDEYCYIDPSSFKDSDVLFNIQNNETSPVSLLTKDVLKGVYISNRGIAEFARIDIIKIIDDFALIEGNGSVNVYDNIVLDSGSVVENEIIY